MADSFVDQAVVDTDNLDLEPRKVELASVDIPVVDSDVDSCQVDKDLLDLLIEDKLGRHMGQVLVESFQGLRFQELEQKLKLEELALVGLETLLEIADSIDCC